MTLDFFNKDLIMTLIQSPESGYDFPDSPYF